MNLKNISQDFGQEIMPLIGITSKIIDHYHTRALQQNGFNLTKEQWVLLKILKHYEGHPQNSIACITKRDKTALARLISTLERKDLVTRVVSKNDKRIKHIQLTNEGEKMLKDTRKIGIIVSNEMMKGISENEITQVISTLSKIQNNINDTNDCFDNQ